MSMPGDDRVEEVLEDGPARYAAYANRLRTLLVASSRYVAYSSDIGEAFRPLTTPAFVRGAYAVSWLYLTGDVGYAGYKAHQQWAAGAPAGEAASAKAFNALPESEKTELRRRAIASGDKPPAEGTLEENSQQHGEFGHVGLVMARRAVFQSIASMALPAFTIHSIVRYSAPLFAKSASQRVRASGPTVAGLAFVPALPYLFDHPVEKVVDTVFDRIEETFMGKGKNPILAAKEALHDGKEKLQEGAEKAKHGGARLRDEASEKFDAAKARVQQGADEAQKQASKGGEEAKSRLEMLRQKASQLKDGAADKLKTE